jgi:monovalent cation:H+ antiporter-2, CPA2 family
MDTPLARDLLLLAIAAIVIALLLSRLRLPAIAGLLVAGALVGPHGLGLAAHSQDLESFAEVGVVLLLFTIGLEFSLKRMARIGRTAAFTGLIQVGATVLAVTLGALALGQPLNHAVFFGMVFALSSTAIVLRSLEERNELDAPHGRLILGTLIMQDLAIVPMILLLPMLASGGAEDLVPQLLIIAAKAIVLAGGALLFARYVLPRIMSFVDATRSRELFLLTVAALCAGMVWLSLAAGLSLALGAFLAGIMLADSAFAHRAVTELLPLRDVMISFFFMAIGMQFDWRELFSAPGQVLLLLALLLLGKGLIASLGVMLLRLPARVALLFGFGLAQFGEFGYLLLNAGGQTVPPLVAPSELPALYCAGILSMFATPLILRLTPHIAAGERLFKPLERLLGARSLGDQAPQTNLSGHVIVAGYGPVGRSVAQSLQAQGIPYIVYELNSETVRQAQAGSEPVYYADITSRQALLAARVEQALALVLAINDAPAIERTIAAARPLNPALAVIARTRYAADVATLAELGATVTVADERESADALVREVRAILQS